MTQSYRDYSGRNVSQLPQYKRIVLRLFLLFGGILCCGGSRSYRYKIISERGRMVCGTY